MVDLLVVEVGKLGKDLVDDGVILSQGAKAIFLLNEVKSDGFVPVELADLREELFILLRGEELKSEEDKSSSKIGVFLPHLVIYLVKGIHVHLLIMLFHVVALLVVLIELGQEGSEFDPFVAVFYVFEKHMLGVFFEDVKCEDQDEEVAYFLLEFIPHFCLLEGHTLQFLSG